MGPPPLGRRALADQPRLRRGWKIAESERREPGHAQPISNLADRTVGGRGGSDHGDSLDARPAGADEVSGASSMRSQRSKTSRLSSGQRLALAVSGQNRRYHKRT